MRVRGLRPARSPFRDGRHGTPAALGIASAPGRGSCAGATPCRDGFWVLAPDGQDGVQHHRLGRVDVAELAVREPQCLPMVGPRTAPRGCRAPRAARPPDAGAWQERGTARPPGPRERMPPHRLSGEGKRHPSHSRRTTPASAARAPDGRAQTDRPEPYARGTASAVRLLFRRNGRHSSDARRGEARRVRQRCRARSPCPVWRANPRGTRCAQAFSPSRNQGHQRHRQPPGRHRLPRAHRSPGYPIRKSLLSPWQRSGRCLQAACCS